MDKYEKNEADKKEGNPNIAVSMEMDELKEGATEEEIKKGDYTPVTNLVYDYEADTNPREND